MKYVQNKAIGFRCPKYLLMMLQKEMRFGNYFLIFLEVPADQPSISNVDLGTESRKTQHHPFISAGKGLLQIRLCNILNSSG